MKEAKLKRAVIKEELLALTGNYVDAIILNQFLYWADRVNDFDNYEQEEQEIAQKSGVDFIPHYKFGWIYKSAKELSAETMLGISETSMRSHVQAIVASGLLSERNNPNYKWDKKKQYRVNVVYIQQKLFQLGYNLDGYKIVCPTFAAESDTEDFENGSSNNDVPSSKFEVRECKKLGAIPETTTEITSKTSSNGETIVSLPMKDGSLFVVTESMLPKWETAYSDVDIRQELLKMKCWLEANRSKQPKCAERFIVKWLNKIKPKQILFATDSLPYMLSKLLAKDLHENNPKVTINEDTIQLWAIDINELISTDNADADDIAEVIEWCQQDDFWKSRIVSGKDLRRNYLKLSMQAQSERK